MPATKTEELRLLSNEDLVAKLKESKEELFGSALPVRHRPAGEPRPPAGGQEGHRSYLHDHA